MAGKQEQATLLAQRDYYRYGLQGSHKAVFPKNVSDILRSLSPAHFFFQGLLVGSWVMLLYKVGQGWDK